MVEKLCDEETFLEENCTKSKCIYTSSHTIFIYTYMQKALFRK